MKLRFKPLAITVSLLVLLVSASCLRQEQDPVPAPLHTKEMPELFEEELLGLYSNGWKELSDTLSYYYDKLLSKGASSGTGPDGVRYSLEMERTPAHVDASFSIQDSVWVEISGTMSPLEIALEACNSTVRLYGTDDGGIRADTGKLGFIFQINSGTNVTEVEIPILMNNSRIGFFSIDPFEYPDYTTGYCLVAHFDDSPISLCYRDKLGLFHFISYLADRQ